MIAFLLAGSSLAAPPSAPLTLDVPPELSDGRPLEVAARELTLRHHWAISYEDPVLLAPDDLVDIGPALGMKVPDWAPGGGRIHLVYNPADGPQKVLEALVAEHAAEDNPGRFEVIQQGSYWVIRPTQVQDATGAWVAAARPLDALVSFPTCHTDEDCAAALTDALARAGYTVIDNLNGSSRLCEISASNESARSVLTRINACDPDGWAWPWFLRGGGGPGWILNRNSVNPDAWACGYEPPGAFDEISTVSGHAETVHGTNPNCARAVGGFAK